MSQANDYQRLESCKQSLRETIKRAQQILFRDVPVVQCPSLIHPRTIKQTPTNFEFILGLLMNRTSVQINALSQMLSKQTDAEPQLMKQL